MPRSRSLEHELDRLYGLPLEEFTAARNAVAAQLKADGDAEAAAEVKALAKPSAAAWILNQLQRQEPQLVRQLLDAGRELRRAQEQALGGGRAEELREATSAERSAVRELVQAAAELHPRGGRAVLDRVRASLSAAASDDEARSLLEQGRVTKEFESFGFPMALGGGAARPAPSARPRPRPKPGRAREARPSDELAERRRLREEQRERVRALRARIRELKSRAIRADQEARRAERVAAQARTAADRAEQRSGEAARKAAELAAEVERAEAELAEAEAGAKR